MYIFVLNNNEIIHYGQRHQSHQGGACREKENEQVVGRATGLCAYYCFQVVYKRLSASDGAYIKIAKLLEVELSELVNRKFGDTI